MERNTDKIKRLEYELERYRQKVGRQEGELRRLREERSQALDGLAAAHATMNVDIAVLAMAHGKKTKDGWELTMPPFDPQEIARKWQVTAEKAGEGYLLRVTEAEQG